MVYSNNKKTWNLFGQLRSLSFEERVSIIGRLLLYALISSDEFLLNNQDSFALDSERYYDLINKIKQCPQNSCNIIEEAFRKIEAGAKNEKTRSLLHFVFSDNVRLFHYRDNNIILAKYACITEDIADINLYIDFERGQWTPSSSALKISDGVTNIMRALVEKQPRFYSNIFCPISGQSYSAEIIAAENGIRDIYIQDNNKEAIILSLALLLSRGHKFEEIDCRISDFLLDYEQRCNRFDLQIACLPFGRSLIDRESDLIKWQIPNFIFELGEKPMAETIYLKRIIDGMKDDGYAYIQIAGKPLFNQNESSISFRRILLRSGVLKGIIRLPERSSPFTSIPSFLLVLHKTSNPTIFFADATDYFRYERTGAYIDKNKSLDFVNDILNRKEKNAIYVDKDDESLDYSLNPDYYLKKPILDKILSGEGSNRLCEIADILSPTEDYNSSGEMIDLKNLQGYPFNRRTMLCDGHSSVMVQKGDIIIHGQITAPKIYLIDDDLGLIFAPKKSVVIRPKSIQPEYLAIYLESEAAKTSLGILHSVKGLGYKMFTSVYITAKMMDDFPVPKPGRAPEEYRKIFEIENKRGLDFEELNEFFSAYRKTEERTEVSIDDILDDELLRNAPRYQEEIFDKCVGEDIDELKICYNNGAYKAATILAGSILEAVLIDWLSDIKKKNYFKKQYKVNDEKTGRSRKAGLGDYINEIKVIKMPEWMKEAEEAHHIREKRNSVHAKISYKTKIDKNECDQVIKYLQDVLSSRKRNA